MTQPSAEVTPGKRGTTRAFQADLLDQGADMQRAAAAERHRREFRRVVTTLDRDEADRARHARVGDLDDRLGGCLHVEPERLADMSADRALRGIEVEPGELAADRPIRIDAAEHDMGVGQGRALVALAVAGGSGHRTRAFRADVQQAAAIDRGDRAAAGADGGDLDHRRADDEAEVDRGLRRERRLGAGDHGDVERRAAEIGR